MQRNTTAQSPRLGFKSQLCNLLIRQTRSSPLCGRVCSNYPPSLKFSNFSPFPPKSQPFFLSFFFFLSPFFLQNPARVQIQHMEEEEPFREITLGSNPAQILSLAADDLISLHLNSLILNIGIIIHIWQDYCEDWKGYVQSASPIPEPQ